MKFFLNRVDRFCAAHPRFGIPNLMLYVVVGNAVVWLFSMFTALSGAGSGILEALYFSPYHILHGQVWRLVTFIIIPNSSGVLALIFFYFYYMIGRTVEAQWGAGKFTVYFFTGVLLTVLYGFFCYFVFHVNMAVSAQFIYLSLFFSFATLYPEMQVLLFFIIPLKIKWLAIVDAAFFLYNVVVPPFPANLLPLVAVGNYLLFCGGWLLAAVRRLFSGKRAQQRQNTVNFKSEVRRAQQEQRQRPYTRRCEVCGRTDVSDPGLEFRYCSRCQGYHCFCMEHINNHRHFTE